MYSSFHSQATRNQLISRNLLSDTSSFKSNTMNLNSVLKQNSELNEVPTNQKAPAKIGLRAQVAEKSQSGSQATGIFLAL